MVKESSIKSKDMGNSSDTVYKVKPSTLEREMQIPIWYQWQAHFISVVEETEEEGDLHIKHPFESSMKGYDRVKLDKVGTFADERFEIYKNCIDSTKEDGDGIDAFLRYHEEGKYSSFALERLFDMVEMFSEEGFSVSLTQNVLDSYQKKVLND